MVKKLEKLTEAPKLEVAHQVAQRLMGHNFTTYAHAHFEAKAVVEMVEGKKERRY